MNNPGQTIADYGFAGDSLQFRTLTGEGGNERVEHFTAWRGRDRTDLIKVEHGRTFTDGVTVDAKKTDGARQAFSVNADGKGYVQEIAIPWKLITRDGRPLAPGAAFTLTFEPNFTVSGTGGRLTVKDLFRPGGKLDRVFTFTNPGVWGRVTLEKQGEVAPQPLRLADGRTFPVTLRDGALVVDWSGLETTAQADGVVPISFALDRDSYVSLNIKNAQGQVVRQLLNTVFFKQGRHEVKWDGATTPSWTRPGEFVAAGDYTWSALAHSGLGLKLRGWAANGGVVPWDSADGRGNWGGDHGVPAAVATDEARVYLGWSGAEAGKAVVACDLQGRPLWSNNRAGIAGVKSLAAAEGVLYVLGGAAGPDAEGGNLYKLDVRNGSYVTWESGEADVKIAALWPAAAFVKPAKADAVAAADGRVFLSFAAADLIAVVDGKTGRLLRTVAVKSPGALCIRAGRLYALSGADRVVTFGAADNPGAPEPVGPDAPTVAFTFGQKTFFRASGDPVNQIAVYPAGTALSPALTIGIKGGRALLGAWQPNGVRFVQAMAVDAEDKLWVVEADSVPKRISVWNSKTGGLVREFFGPTSYGALGGAISPLDPDVMVGQGCEWRIDPQTGLGRLTTVITRDGMENSRFAVGANGRLYLAVASGWIPTSPKVSFFERVGEAAYKLRSVFRYEGKDATAQTVYWADENGDEQEQPNEITRVSGHKNFSGWYMTLAPDLSIYAGGERFKVSGFTACGAPRYDLGKPEPMPFAGGLGSADGRLLARGGDYGEEHTRFTMVELATGRVRWTYPDNFNGVHGSHNAPPPAVGLVRGSFGLAGTAKLPAPIGNVWVSATNVGEWHLLTEDGFYLGKLFEGDPLKVKWPARAVPGADMTHAPPGMGGEDFGGTLTGGKDGKLYVQAGKTAYWNLEVTGLETVRALPGGKIALSGDDLIAAHHARETRGQATAGPLTLVSKKGTPTLNGRFDSDFGDAQAIEFKKGDSDNVRFAATFNATTLFLQWDVRDQTPWVNGAQAAEQMYVGGDTVDFQLAADPGAEAQREKPVLGDWRLSIGNFKGTPTAVLYRPVANGDQPRRPRSFSSGIIKDYVVADVRVLTDADLKVEKRGDGYVVQAAIPWAALEMAAPAGRTLRGDFGVTYGDAAGQRTRLRSYWSNQHTGLVDDVVFELLLEPRYWGDITFP